MAIAQKLGAVRVSRAEKERHERCAADLGVSRSRWVRAVLEWAIQVGMDESQVDVAIGALARLARQSGGLSADLSSVQVYKELMCAVDGTARSSGINRSDWVRAALYTAQAHRETIATRLEGGAGRRTR